MASEVKADKLSPSTGTALQIGDASDTITIPTGATFTITDGLGVAGGGTGLTGFTAGDVLYATGTTTLAKLAKGTAEQVLAMNSGATAPDWGSVDLTVLPTITVAKGGTNLSSFTAGDILYATGSTTLAKLGKGTGLQGLQTNSGATAPEWVNSPQSLMTAAGDILYASGANTLAKLAKGSDDEILTLASGVPSWAAAAGGGKVLQVIQNFWTGEETTTSTLGSFAIMSDSITAITPASTSNKILVVANISTGSTSYEPFLKLQHNGSGSYVDKGIGTGATSNRINISWKSVKQFGGVSTFVYLDSPSIDSSFNYQLVWNSRAAGTVTTQTSDEQTDAAYVGWTGSSMTLIEIDGT